MKSTFRWIMMTLALTVATLLLLPSKSVPRGPWIAEGVEQPDLLRTLAWYAQQSPGSLDLSFIYLYRNVTLASVDLYSRTGSDSRSNASGLLHDLPPELKSQAWWPHLAQDVLYFSPVIYEVMSIERVSTSTREHLEYLDIEYTARIAEVSPILTFFEQASSSIEAVRGPLRSSDYWKERIGSTVRQAVSMPSGIYGYYLPLYRNPLSFTADNHR